MQHNVFTVIVTQSTELGIHFYFKYGSKYGKFSEKLTFLTPPTPLIPPVRPQVKDKKVNHFLVRN